MSVSTLRGQVRVCTCACIFECLYSYVRTRVHTVLCACVCVRACVRACTHLGLKCSNVDWNTVCVIRRGNGVM